MAEEKTQNSGQESKQDAVDPKIDAIKQLIFGDNMVEYDERFDKLVAKIEKSTTELSNKLDKQNQSLMSSLNSLKDQLEKTISALEKTTNKEMARLDDTKANRKTLGKMLQNIGDKLVQ